jgi:hypothetical protein
MHGVPVERSGKENGDVLAVSPKESTFLMVIGGSQV